MPERTISGLKFKAEKLPAAKSLPMFLRTSKVIAPASGLIEAIMLDSEAIDLVPQFFAFVEKAETDELVSIAFELAECCELEGKPFNPRETEVELAIILGAAWFAAEVNFGGFLLASRGSDDPNSPADVAA